MKSCIMGMLLTCPIEGNLEKNLPFLATNCLKIYTCCMLHLDSTSFLSMKNAQSHGHMRVFFHKSEVVMDKL